jgi:beta-lactamase regulating signal transducer with metallopeptidase domain
VKAIEEFLVRATLEGGAALLVVFVICRVFMGIPARMKCWLWRLAWLRVILTIFSWKLIEAPLLSAKDAPKELFVEARKSSTHSGAQPKMPPVPVTALADSLKHRQPSENFSRINWLVAAWMLGVAVAIGRIAFQFHAARSLRGAGSSMNDLEAELKSACEEIGVAKPVLLISKDSEKPVLVGVFHPTIVLPATLVGNECVDLIFRHELAHLKRSDLIWNWLTAIGGSLLWFHPLAWLGVRETNLAQEMACDEMALRSNPLKAPMLANLLIDLASGHNAGSSPSISAVGMIQTKTSLERRIKSMKVQRHSGWWMLVAIGIAAPAIVPWRVVAQKAKEPEAASAKTNEQQVLAKPITPGERAELERQLKLAEADLKEAWTLVGSTLEKTDVLEKARQVAQLRGKVAFAKKDLTGVKKSLIEQINTTRELVNEVANHVALGLASRDQVEKYESELRDLRKNLDKYGPDMMGARTAIPVTRDGIVASVFKKWGDRVKRNDEILRMNDEEARIKLQTAKSELEIAEADYKLQTIDIQNRLESLKERQGLSIEEKSFKEKAELQLKRARAQLAIAEQKLQQAQLELAAYTVRAPKDGYVANIPRVGSRIGPGIGLVEYLPDDN